MNPASGDEFEAELQRLTELLTKSEPSSIQPGIVIPRQGVTYLSGTTLPAVTSGAFGSDPVAGIVRPRPREQGLAPYVAAFLIQADYLDSTTSINDLEKRLQLWAVHDPSLELITTLCAISRCAGDHDELIAQLIADYSSWLKPDAAARLRAKLTDPDVPRRFLARQAVLNALRHVLLADPALPSLPIDPMVKAVFLAHGTAQTLDNLPAGRTPFATNVSAELAVALAQNYLFHKQQDLCMRLLRSDELWGVYGAAVAASDLNKTADDLFTEATGGIERRDFMALGFGLWSQAMAWKPGTPFLISPLRLANDPTGERTERVMEFLSRDQAELAAALNGAGAGWQLEPFEESPILRTPNGLAVIDMMLLVNRITSCIADIVFESLRSKGTGQHVLWSREYGHIVEQLAIAYARRLAPTAIGGGANFYDEDALEAFVGDGRVCDAAIDFGDAMLLLEIQRGEVQAEIRYEGSVPRFLKHIDQAIVSKTEQLDSVALHILDDETPLTGIAPQRDPRPRIYPVVVQGDGFAIEPISQGYIRKKVRDQGWLVHAKIETLSVIDTDELQMLVGLFESRGLSPTQLLQEWHASSHDLYSLRNYLLYAYPDRSPEDLRPKGAGPAWESLGEEIKSRLELPEGKTENAV